MLSEVYDLEVLSNLFTYTGYCRTSKTWHQFVIHESQNDITELYTHLFRDVLIMTGFNNDSFDYPMLHHLINHYQEYKDLDGDTLARNMYRKAQSIIEEAYTVVADKNKFIKQVDLFKIHHFDGAAKSSNLKDLEFTMRMCKLEEMPIDHRQHVLERDIPMVLAYNKNDVEATCLLLDYTLGNVEHPVYKGQNKVELRASLKRKFNLKCDNFNDVKIGEQLILQEYCKLTGKDMWVVKKMKTYRSKIELKDCIPHWTHIITPQFKKVLDVINKTVVDASPGIKQDKQFAYSLIYKGVSINFGLGGTHACNKPGIYRSENGRIILDLDVGGMYPSIGLTLGLYPEHLGIEFLDVYRWIVATRLAEKAKPKDQRDNCIISGFKLAANGAYGKTGEETSFLYDPLYKYKTTIAGQMFICMWLEQICGQLNNVEIIQVNTK